MYCVHVLDDVTADEAKIVFEEIELHMGKIGLPTDKGALIEFESKQEADAFIRSVDERVPAANPVESSGV